MIIPRAVEDWDSKDVDGRINWYSPLGFNLAMYIQGILITNFSIWSKNEWNTQEFQTTIVISKTYNKHLRPKEADLLFVPGIICLFRSTLQVTTVTLLNKTLLLTWAPWHNASLWNCNERNIFLVQNVWAIRSNSRYFDSVFQGWHITQPLVMG